MIDALVEFRCCVARQPFRWGDWDCGLLCADWVMVRRGVDPAHGWRGRYGTPLGCARLLKRRGGLVAHFDACLAPYGIKRTSKPKRGDVAVVETEQGLSGGVITGPLVMIACMNGGIIERSLKFAPIVAAWRI